MTFSKRCGKSIILTDENKCAERVDGYNCGIVYSKRPLCVKLSEIFEVKIEATLEEKWAGSLVSNNNFEIVVLSFAFLSYTFES